MATFKKNDLVRHKDTYTRGRVLSNEPDVDGNVSVKWKASGYISKQVKVDDLVLADEVADKTYAQKLQKKLNTATDLLSKGFALFQQVKNDAMFHSLVDDKLLSTKDLEDELEEHGWSSSSLYC